MNGSYGTTAVPDAFVNGTTPVPYGREGYLPVTYAVLGIRALIGSVGIVLNWCLVVVTVKKKSFRGTCGILLALDALGHSLYETGLLTTFTAAIVNGKHVDLQTCIFLQSLSLPGAIFTTPSMTFIALDRLVAVIFPRFLSGSIIPIYLIAVVALCCLYSAYVTTRSTLNVIGNPSAKVMCTLSDCYGPQLGGEVGRNANILQITAIVCYILLWIRLRTIDKKNSDAKLAQPVSFMPDFALNHSDKPDDLSQEARHKNSRFYEELSVPDASIAFTRRIFKSLAIIVLFVGFNMLFNLASLQLLPLFGFDPTTRSHVSMALGYLPNIAGASHSVVLFVFSTEYRGAFRTLYRAVVYHSDRWSTTAAGGSFMTRVQDPRAARTGATFTPTEDL